MEKVTKRVALSAILSSLNEVATAEGTEFVLASVPASPPLWMCPLPMPSPTAKTS